MWHCLLCRVPWGLILSVSPLLPEPMLAFQLTCSRWAAQWGGHWHRQMCLFTGDKTLCCCRWQCPGASGALWHYCHTTAISALQGELLFFKHSTSWFVCGFRAWWYKPCHQIFFFPVDYLTFFTLICGLQGLTLALPIYLNCMLDSWRLLIMWLIKT